MDELRSRQNRPVNQDWIVEGRENMTAREDGSRLAQLWSANSIPDQGEMIIDLTWKSSATRNAFLRRFVSAPRIALNITGDDDCWSDFIDDAVAAFQKKLIQAYVTAELEKQNKWDTKYAVPVPAEFFDKDALLEQWERMEAESGQGRGKLSAAAIGEFFEKSVEPILSLAIVEAWNWNEESLEDKENQERLRNSVQGYRDILLDLEKQPKHKLENARKALSKCDVLGTAIGKRLDKKIGKLLAPRPGTDKSDFANVF